MICKRKACEGCGKVMFDVSDRRLYCDECRARRDNKYKAEHRDEHRVYMHKYNTRTATITCQKCGKTVVAPYRRQYCDECRRLIWRQAAFKRDVEKRKRELQAEIDELKTQLATLEAKLDEESRKVFQ